MLTVAARCSRSACCSSPSADLLSSSRLHISHPSHEIKSSSSLIEAEATIRWRSSLDKEYHQSLPHVTKCIEDGCPLVVRYVTVQFADQAHPVDDAASTHPPGSAVVDPCTVVSTSDSIWENGPYFTTTDIKSIFSPPTPTPQRCRPRQAPSSLSPPDCLSPLPTPDCSGMSRWPQPNHTRSRWAICSTCHQRPPPSRRQSILSRTSHSRPRFSGAIVGGSLYLSGAWS